MCQISQLFFDYTFHLIKIIVVPLRTYQKIKERKK